MDIKFQEDVLNLKIEKEIYSVDVLFKCFYWYGANFTIEIEDFSPTLHLVLLKSNNGEFDKEHLIEKIKRDLIDFKLRDIVNKETKIIRELLIAKAFANYIDLEEDPTTNVSDSVGFNPISLEE